MKPKNSPIHNIDDYIATFPANVQKLLTSVRSTIAKAAANAEETIAYGIPTFKLSGNLVHFAAFKSHIGFYPTPSGIAAFADELKEYKTAKGSVQFPLDQPIPLSLIRRIVVARVKENTQKTQTRKKAPKKTSSQKTA